MTYVFVEATWRKPNYRASRACRIHIRQAGLQASPDCKAYDHLLAIGVPSPKPEEDPKETSSGQSEMPKSAAK